MLELPESLTLARQLDEALRGKTIERAVAAQSPHRFAFYTGEPADYAGLLEGRCVTGASAVGGWVELSLGERSLYFFDGARLRLYTAGEKLPPKHQLLLTFAGGESLVCTVQMYAGLLLCAEQELDNPYYRAAKEKPSPLDDRFDRAYFLGLVRAAKKGLSAKALLATEQRIPGLGNGCLQDILWVAGVHPKRKVASLDDDQLEALFQSVRKTLAKMAQGGGRDTERDLFGEPGGYRSVLSAKTLPYPCPRCGGGIVRSTYLGGNVYACPHCQPQS